MIKGMLGPTVSLIKKRLVVHSSLKNYTCFFKNKFQIPKFHLSYNTLLPRRVDSWLPSPPPRVCTVSVRSYALVITKFWRMDRSTNFLSKGFHSRALRIKQLMHKAMFTSCRIYFLVGMLWTPIPRYITVHFRDRRGAASPQKSR